MIGAASYPSICRFWGGKMETLTEEGDGNAAIFVLEAEI